MKAAALVASGWTSNPREGKPASSCAWRADATAPHDQPERDHFAGGFQTAFSACHCARRRRARPSLQLHERVDEVDQRPEVLLGQRHRGQVGIAVPPTPEAITR